MLAKGSFSFIAPPSLIGALFAIAGYLVEPSRPFYVSAFLAFLLAILLAIFFRDPERAIGHGVVAPADGYIMRITRDKSQVVICTFMNIHNVHVNRAPLTGRILEVKHYPGKHVPAFDKDSDRNERVVIWMHTKLGRVKLVQIAGAVARRIVPYVKKGQTVKKGQRIGLIRLGSRVDVYLPAGVKLLVRERNKVLAGTSPIAEEGDAD